MEKFDRKIKFGKKNVKPGSGVAYAQSRSEEHLNHWGPPEAAADGTDLTGMHDGVKCDEARELSRRFEQRVRLLKRTIQLLESCPFDCFDEKRAMLGEQ